MSGVYTVTIRHRATVATAITILQVKAGPAAPFQILRAWCNQTASETSQQEEIQLLRKTAAATVTLAVVGTHVFKHATNDPTPGVELGTAATGVIATAEGTDGDVIEPEGFNVLNGWLWVPTEKERLWVPGGGIVALKFPVAPTSATFNFGMRIEEHRG
jgi:hypothetical protein